MAFEDRVIARLLAPWLDRELAAGLGASLSEAHAARAGQLVAPRVRCAVAQSLDELLNRARKPRRAAPIATSPPCPEQIALAAPLIEAVASRLRSHEPIDARAVARLKVLVGDRCGPCYTPSDPDALARALREIVEEPGAVDTHGHLI
ncbi:MAG TPA: hypothetical protein VMF57_15045 [Solirubrobacteraceae bacterium]|nr:hypothetical protein [Solirubrobacteraceae bacterium]